MKQVLKKLTIAYYLIYVAAIAVAAAGYLFFRSGLVIDPKSQAGIVISSVLIFLIICSIPLTLQFLTEKPNNGQSWKIHSKSSENTQKLLSSGLLL